MFVRTMGTRAALLAMLASAGLQASTIVIPQPAFRQVYALNPTGHVAIHNLYGNVRITAWDRDEVLVEAVKRSKDPRQLEDARIEVDSSADQISVRTLYGGADMDHPASVEYRITVPRNANLDNVRLVNGGLSITGLAGSVKASSVNGSIKAEQLEGQADLSTINGQLEADFNRIQPAGSISLSSVNGPIRVSLPADATLQLAAHNLSGGIESDIGRAWRESNGMRLRIMRRGGAQVHVNNVNGGIWIRCPQRPT